MLLDVCNVHPNSLSSKEDRLDGSAYGASLLLLTATCPSSWWGPDCDAIEQARQGLAVPSTKHEGLPSHVAVARSES
jgi:hypothetical protein